MVRLINKHREKVRGQIDITRTTGSPLCNPHRGAGALDNFKRYALDQMSQPSTKFYQAVKVLRKRWDAGEEIVLACVCKPKKCHGDFVVYLIENFEEI